MFGKPDYRIFSPSRASDNLKLSDTLSPRLVRRFRAQIAAIKRRVD